MTWLSNLSLLFPILIHPALQEVMWHRRSEQPEETCLSLAILVRRQVIWTFFLPLQTSAYQRNSILLYCNLLQSLPFVPQPGLKMTLYTAPSGRCPAPPHLLPQALSLAYTYAGVLPEKKSSSALPHSPKTLKRLSPLSLPPSLSSTAVSKLPTLCSASWS